LKKSGEVVQASGGQSPMCGDGRELGVALERKVKGGKKVFHQRRSRLEELGTPSSSQKAAKGT